MRHLQYLANEYKEASTISLRRTQFSVQLRVPEESFRALNMLGTLHKKVSH